jgi:hypothetical protein
MRVIREICIVMMIMKERHDDNRPANAKCVRAWVDSTYAIICLSMLLFLIRRIAGSITASILSFSRSR